MWKLLHVEFFQTYWKYAVKYHIKNNDGDRETIIIIWGKLHFYHLYMGTCVFRLVYSNYSNQINYSFINKCYSSYYATFKYTGDLHYYIKYWISFKMKIKILLMYALFRNNKQHLFHNSSYQKHIWKPFRLSSKTLCFFTI